MSNKTITPSTVVPIREFALGPRQYDEQTKERARDLYMTVGIFHAPAVSEYMRQEAIENAIANGEQTIAYPSPKTIQRWAREGHWKRQYYDEFGSTLNQSRAELRIKMEAMGHIAINSRIMVSTGAYNGNPQAGLLHLKNAEGIERLLGSGTFASQFGGKVEASIDDLESDDALPAETDDEDPFEESRRLREQMLDDKRGIR